jgi:tetratricopeptide (TPR) repeat protein
MNTIFEKVFKRNRTTNHKPTGRKLSMLSKLFGGGSRDFLTNYRNAQSNYNSGNYKKALNQINKTIELSDINDWKQYAFKANVLEDLQDFEKAIEYYEKAININLNDDNVYALYHQIGYCYLNQKNDKKASEFYSYAIDLKGKHTNTEMNPDQEGMDLGVMLGVPFKRMYNNRANAYKNLGQLDVAIEDCNKSLNYDKNYSNPYFMLSQIYSEAGQEEKAIEYLKVSAQLGNNSAMSTLKQIGLL